MVIPLVIVIIVLLVYLTWLMKSCSEAKAIVRALKLTEEERSRSLSQILLNVKKHLEEFRDVDSGLLLLADELKKRTHSVDALVLRTVGEDKGNYFSSLGDKCQSDIDSSERLDSGLILPKKMIFESKLRNSFLYNRNSHIIDQSELYEIFPDFSMETISSALATPIQTAEHEDYIVLFKARGTPVFEKGDRTFLDNSVAFAELANSSLELSIKFEDLEDSIHKAHEEGMLQISTGIIHNIGNGVAVIQLALDHMNEINAVKELSAFLHGELLPGLRQQLNIDASKSENDKIIEFWDNIDQISKETNRLIDKFQQEYQTTKKHFSYVSDVITLQQQFIGELGTENVTPIGNIFSDVLGMCQAPLEENGIELGLDLEANADLLVDPALMKHILLLLIKYSVESINRLYRKPAIIKFTTNLIVSNKKSSKPDTLLIKIHNNGYGIELEQEKESLTQDKNATQRIRDFAFCRRRIQKYDGDLIVETNPTQGATVSITLPIIVKD